MTRNFQAKVEAHYRWQDRFLLLTAIASTTLCAFIFSLLINC